MTKTCDQYMGCWQQGNFGHMAKMVSSMVRTSYGNAMPRHVREECREYELVSYKTLRVAHTAPATCEIDVELMFKSGDCHNGRMRWIYEDEQGDTVASSLPGRWCLIVWEPLAIINRRRE